MTLFTLLPLTGGCWVLKMYDVLFLFFIFFWDTGTQEVKKGIL